MSWSRDQVKALDDVARWFKNPRAPYFLGGWAGTGKSTLARHFASGVGKVKFAAFSGKAASVLQKKGCEGATTIHSLIYQPVGSSNEAAMEDLTRHLESAIESGREQDAEKIRDDLRKLREESQVQFAFQPNPEALEADLIIIDEGGMVGRRAGEDLESLGVPILYLGDPGQLPPVGDRAHLTRKPDFVLEEIHRQAADNPVIQLAHHIRKGGWFKIGDMGETVRVRSKADWNWDFVETQDAVLVGRNMTRQNVNRAMRKRLGKTTVMPEKGDKLLCLKNDRELGILNGVECTATEDATLFGNSVLLHIDYEDRPLALACDPAPFEKTYGKQKSFPHWRDVSHFDYAYALTVHKAQGSQWRNLVICDDQMQVGNETFRRQWGYTAVTRTEENLSVYI